MRCKTASNASTLSKPGETLFVACAFCLVVKAKIFLSPSETISTSLWASLHHRFPVLSVFSHVCCHFIFCHIFPGLVNPSPSRPPLLLFSGTTMSIIFLERSSYPNVSIPIYPQSLFTHTAMYSFIHLSELGRRGENENAQAPKQQQRAFEPRLYRLQSSILPHRTTSPINYRLAKWLCLCSMGPFKCYVTQ